MNYVGKIIQVKTLTGDFEIGRLQVLNEQFLILEDLDDSSHLTLIFKENIAKFEIFLDEKKIEIRKIEESKEENKEENSKFYMDENKASQSFILFDTEKDPNDIDLNGPPQELKNRIKFESEQ